MSHFVLYIPVAYVVFSAGHRPTEKSLHARNFPANHSKRCGPSYSGRWRAVKSAPDDRSSGHQATHTVTHPTTLYAANATYTLLSISLYLSLSLSLHRYRQTLGASISRQYRILWQLVRACPGDWITHTHKEACGNLHGIPISTEPRNLP